MRIITFIIISLSTSNYLKAQTTKSNLIEGGRALVELISVLKKNKPNVSSNQKSVEDSCSIKRASDLCFKNSSNRDLSISLFKRSASGYDALPFTMKVITKQQECWYELHSGIYKYKIDIDNAGIKTTLSEGELKLNPCDNMIREIKE
jgi:hypothetical protein